MVLDGVNINDSQPLMMAENSKKEEEPMVKSKEEKTKMAGKETKGVRPDATKKILLMEDNKRLNLHASDTYNDIDIDMEDIDEENLPKLPPDVIKKALEENKKPS